MIKRRKELRNIEGNNTSMTLFKPPSLDEVSEVDAGIGCGPLPDAPKLIQIKESITYHMELETVADGFLNEFTCCVK